MSLQFSCWNFNHLVPCFLKNQMSISESLNGRGCPLNEASSSSAGLGNHREVNQLQLQEENWQLLALKTYHSKPYQAQWDTRLKSRNIVSCYFKTCHAKKTLSVAISKPVTLKKTHWQLLFQNLIKLSEIPDWRQETLSVAISKPVTTNLIKLSDILDWT